MTTITLESIKAEHAKIGDLIAAFEKQQETAAQCGETKKLRAQVLAQQARIAELETTPPDKREDLRCVISDLCHQVRERDARIVTQQAQIEELEAYNSTRTDELLAAGLQVAAQQARIEQLLEAVEYCCSQVQEFITVPGISKALSTPDDLSALRAHDAAIWREAMQIAEDSRNKATMSKYSSVPECRAARDMAECLSKAYCHKADAIEKGGE